MDYFPLVDDEDRQILLHREAHFGGSFEVMIEYYQVGGKGVQEDFSVRRLEELADMERRLGDNLAAQVLQPEEAEQVHEIRECYENLKSVYEENAADQQLATLIADLILTEDVDATEEIQALVAKGDAVIPPLVELLQSETFSNPLYPGYGHGPALAARCLGQLANAKTIIPLFETLNRGDFLLEEAAISALQAIGEPARDFLMQVVQSQPITEDNERAVVGLVRFNEDPEVQRLAASVYDSLDSAEHPVLCEYLKLIPRPA